MNVFYVFFEFFKVYWFCLVISRLVGFFFIFFIVFGNGFLREVVFKDVVRFECFNFIYK